MQQITAKKHFGQHFLKDENTAQAIVALLKSDARYDEVLEIGPGMGVLTQFLFQREDVKTKIIEIDKEAIAYLQKQFPEHISDILQGDFLQMDLKRSFDKPFAIIGNFPYNISSQILFKALDNKEMVPKIVGMFQKEVAERIASPPGNRDYGILSVLMQAFYQIELVMMLNEEDFSPPPKVKSAILRFDRKENFQLKCDEKSFRNVVKTAFNQRRKTLHNALKQLINQSGSSTIPYQDKRAETLTWQQFEELTLLLQSK